MNILIIEDSLDGKMSRDFAAIIAAGHTIYSCRSTAEWRRRINKYSNRKDSGCYNNYTFSKDEFPWIDEEQIDIVMTDLFLPVDGTGLGYTVNPLIEPELPYGYIIAIRYLAMGKPVAIVTNGQIPDPRYGQGRHTEEMQLRQRTADHHSSPLMSANDMLMLRYGPGPKKFLYHPYKDYRDAFNMLDISPMVKRFEDVFPYDLKPIQ